MTRLTWGRRPVDDRELATRRRSVVLVVALLIGLAASVDGFVHRSIIEADTPVRIQQLLDQHLRTLERGDDFQYRRTLDRQSAAHTRCMTDQFERSAERVAELQPNRLIRLEEASRDSAVVRAYVQRRDGVVVEYVRRLQVINFLTLPPFDIRSSFVVWYLSSPSEAELGGHFITGAGDATLESWGIDQEARAAIERELDALSLEFVAPPIEVPGAAPRPGLRVRLLPAPEYGPNGCVSGAVYDPGRGEILVHPGWADAERTSLSEGSRAELREAFRQWARRP